MSPSDGEAHLAGGALLLVVPLLVVAGTFSVRGGYATRDFWATTRDRKLDRIAGNEREWRGMYAAWIAIMAVATAGLLAFSLLLAWSGEEALAGIGLGLFLVGALGWLGGILLQVGPADVAARIRQETGSTPEWLEPLWSAVGWAEPTYIAATGLAYVIWGAAALDGGFPADWAGWASIALGGLAVAGVTFAPSRMTVPEIPLLVPVVVGIALVLR